MYRKVRCQRAREGEREKERKKEKERLARIGGIDTLYTYLGSG